jgi:hypothetical protein
MSLSNGTVKKYYDDKSPTYDDYSKQYGVSSMML